MADSIRLSVVLLTSPQELYDAWLDEDQHAAFTGAEAVIEPSIGGAFTAWDGYISGTTLELEPAKRIVQAWRTTEFPPGSPDSRLEILLEETPKGARMTLVHTEIPDGQGPSYEQGWQDFYIAPMREYFRARGGQVAS
jgi:activator of HSP90 ATPase